jgi:hypothetical protein
MNIFYNSLGTVAHAFGQRYELPIPLFLFVLGGAGIVLLSFLLVLQKKVKKASKSATNQVETPYLAPISKYGTTAGFIILTFIVWAGLTGNQEIAENIVPTFFWLILWIFVPLSCGIVGDWTQPFNPFQSISKLGDNPRLRMLLLNRKQPIDWPSWLGWWPAVLLFFGLASGELIFNQTATLPNVTAGVLLGYFCVSALLGLLFGKAWAERGEVFGVLWSSWGKLGYYRFGAQGVNRFAGGLSAPFEASLSRVSFMLLLLVSVSFDGLLSTPAWSRWQLRLPSSLSAGSLSLKLLLCGVFILLAAVSLAVFTGFAIAVARAGGQRIRPITAFAHLLPSLLPISFGYLLAHNLEYLIVNGQLLFPLIGNPIGKESWPLHLPHPFNDTYEPHIHLLPSAFYWYLAVVVIIIVHIFAVVIAHRYLAGTSSNRHRARRSEYPWIMAMIAYTMISLWLLAQPLVQEKADTKKETTIHMAATISKRQ